jgi:hypothetical protein
MDRLKQEWKEIRISEELRLRARNMAWESIRRPVRMRRALRWAAAASTIAAMVVLAWIWNIHSQGNRIARVPAVVPQQVSVRPKTSPMPEPVVEAAPVLKAGPVKKIAAPRRASAPAKDYERVVLNFRLPESGARMIWIMDSRFNLNGGVQ